MDYAEWLREGADELAAVPQPTAADEAALALELAAENAGADGDEEPDEGPECEWCGAAVPDGRSAFAPYCSDQCVDEAHTELTIEAATAAGEIGPD